jgi:hypothetical protein
MSWLARLKNQKGPDTHATKPTKPPEQAGWAGSVGFVAYPPTPFQKIEASEAAANDATTTPAADPERWCWPHSTAMNGREIGTFTARLARFTDKGLTLADAEQQADRLVIRDREGDDRRLCLECSHLQGAGRWRCGNWQAAEVAREQLAPDLVAMLQRCTGVGGITP